MKKIDLHIHTVATESDASFTFCHDKLKEYIETMKLDCIAITNHNKFDLGQFRLIKEKVSITVLPGIEIDLEGSQLLLIGDGTDIEEFAEKCQKISDLKPTKKDSISVDKLKEIYQDLSKYILIPHYDKNPKIKEETLEKLSTFITAGEVASPKKFIYCQKSTDKLIPVYFSDCRISTNLDNFSIRQTYLDCDEVTFTAIKSCLRDKNKVTLSEEDGNCTFQVFEDGQKISTGLNVVIGERSSGKSYALKKIYKNFENVKYLPQFSLVARDEKEDKKKFGQHLSNGQSFFSSEYLKELQDIVNEVMDIDIESNKITVGNYLESLLSHAKETEKHDAFSKASLFNEEEFQILYQKGLKDLISSTKNLIENIEFRQIIDKHVSIENLKNLILNLMNEYEEKEQERSKKKWLNELIKDVKNKLQIRSSAPTIPDIDLYKIAMDLKKIEKFKNIVIQARQHREIMRKPLQGYEIVASVGEFNGAAELKGLSNSKNAFSEAYKKYPRPYEYLQKLKDIDGLAAADLYNYFVKIDYKVLNKDGVEASGGERSEFNLLQDIQDAQKFNMLLIDEPESSFDNLFLKNGVNKLIKDISKNMPVVIVTHNSTVGASIKPDYLLYTKKEIVDGKPEYKIYSGSPSNKKLVSCDGYELNTWNLIMDCLEAGNDAYNERKQGYEDIKN